MRATSRADRPDRWVMPRTGFCRSTSDSTRCSLAVSRSARSFAGDDSSLVRSPERVLASELRHIRRHHRAERRAQAIRVNARLWMVHLLSVLVFLQQPRDRRLFLRHEDFLASPQTALREILDLVGSDAEIPDLTALKTGVPLLGNKLIRSDVVALEAPAVASASNSRATTMLQAPWRLIFSRLEPAVRV